MNTDLITAAVLFGPAALIGTPLLLAAHRGTRHDKAVLAMLAQERAKRAAVQVEAEDNPPPDGGQPDPVLADTSTGAGTDDLAQITPFPARRAA